MDVVVIKAVDRYLGVPLCYSLSIFKKKLSLIKPQKILFVQLWGLGETICTLPAIKAVKESYPKSVVSVLCTARNKPVYLCAPFVDEVIELDLSPPSLAYFMLKNYNRFDLVFDMEEYLNISALLAFFVGHYRIGYSNQARSRLYDMTINYLDRQHVALTYFDLVRPLGVKPTFDNLEKLFVNKTTALKAKKILSDSGIKDIDFLVGLGIGAAESAKCRRWPLERFAALADYLAARPRAKILFVGSADERKDIEKTLALMKRSKQAINLAGKSNVLELFALISHCKLFIGNDSGPMHIAAAQGVPTIGLFGPNLPERFGPFGIKNRSVYRGSICEFSPCINVHLGETPDCLYPKNSDAYQKCMKNISVSDVIKTVRGMKP